jgi:phenylacetate-CoA ligase
MFERQIYLMGARVRNPSLRRRLEFLKQTEHWPLSKLQEHQLVACREFLEFAGTHSPYYRELFRATGFLPSRMSKIEDIKQLPPITKSELIRHNDAIHADFGFRKLFSCETSGTSGQVLTFKRNEAWDSGNRAAALRGHAWHGVEPWDPSVYFWGFNPSSLSRWKTRLLDSLQNRYRVFDYSDDSLRRVADRLPRVAYLHGYSSMVYELARLVRRRGMETATPNIKMVKGTSEKIYPHYQDVVREAFGKSLVSEYGAAETGIIAFECDKGNMHVHMEGVYAEDDGGEIVVTNLLSYSFPVVRYKLGDYVRFADPGTRCECGMEHPIIEDVEGRVGKSIYGRRNRYPSLTLYYVFKNLYFNHDIKLDYQGSQRKKGHLDLTIEQEMTEDQEAVLREECRKYFGDDVEVAILDGTAIHSRDQKLRDFVSSIAEATEPRTGA